ncbi:hypothetical protein NKR23_g157 [Pleurostoma richardsiae]|uniref:Cyanovirin-N domain-containing protein n=1 Tax=Pleurostoma richardsiae TaxID=41990 RepID=A0AA38VKZ2_9PEZI|nr:hypothetical protein NKR23_g157 [Pleurostoma richardsiae]
MRILTITTPGRVARLACLAAIGLARFAASQGTVGAGGGFGGSCFIPSNIYSDHFLGMYCNNRFTAEYGYNWTWIDLNWCIGNNQGQLAGANNGFYLASCGNCTTFFDQGWQNNANVYLGCNCWTSLGTFPYSTVNLNQFVFNSDGTMGCFSHLGNQTLAGPFPITPPMS